MEILSKEFKKSIFDKIKNSKVVYVIKVVLIVSSILVAIGGITGAIILNKTEVIKKLKYKA